MRLLPVDTVPLIPREHDGRTWLGKWHGHSVRISDELVQSIRENRNGEALLVGPEKENSGMWIATAIPNGWMNVPEVRVWYRYEDFVEYVKMEVQNE